MTERKARHARPEPVPQDESGAAPEFRPGPPSAARPGATSEAATEATPGATSDRRDIDIGNIHPREPGGLRARLASDPRMPAWIWRAVAAAVAGTIISVLVDW